MKNTHNEGLTEALPGLDHYEENTEQGIEPEYVDQPEVHIYLGEGMYLDDFCDAEMDYLFGVGEVL